MLTKKNKLYLFTISLIGIYIISFFIIQDINIFELDPWKTIWNDEIFVYKHFESIAEFGYPKGYFGYNESHALIGGFGAWIPVFFYIYLPFYKLFNGPLGIYVFNLIILIIPFLLMCKLNIIDSYKDAIMYTLPAISFLILRYVFSGMFETLFVSLVLCFFISYKNVGKKQYLVISVIIVLLLTLLRPYMALLFLLIFNKDDISIKSIVKTFFFIFIGVLLYFLIVKLFCAQSLDAPTMAIAEVMNRFSNGFVKGVLINIIELIRSVWIRFLFVINSIKNFDFTQEVFGAAIAYLLYYLTMLIYFGRIIKMIVRKECNNTNGIMLLVLLLMLVAVCFLNSNPTAGNRHLFPVMLLSWYFLIDSNFVSNKFVYILLLSCLFISNILFSGDRFYKLANYDNLEYLDDNLKKLELDDDMRNNTICFEYGVDNDMYLSLKNVPAGFGINICLHDYLKNTDNIKYKYVMISTLSDLNNKYINDNNYKIKYSNDKLVIYEKMF